MDVKVMRKRLAEIVAEHQSVITMVPLPWGRDSTRALIRFVMHDKSVILALSGDHVDPEDQKYQEMYRVADAVAAWPYDIAWLVSELGPLLDGLEDGGDILKAAIQAAERKAEDRILSRIALAIEDNARKWDEVARTCPPSQRASFTQAAEAVRYLVELCGQPRQPTLAGFPIRQSQE